MSFSTPLGKSVYPLNSIGIGSDFQSGYAFKGKDFSHEGYPVIKIKNIQNQKVTLEASQYIPPNIISGKIEKYRLFDGDILIAMTGQGSVGRVGRLKCNKADRPYLNQRVGKFITDEDKLNVDYLFYIISSRPYEGLLFSIGSGSGQPNLSPAIISSVQIPYPPYAVQCEIGRILKTIDNKIELNQRMNKTLEEMARAIFKCWFVDFEPTRAKMAGESEESICSRLKLTREMLAHFPDKLVESELGMNPEGWIISKIRDEADALLGGTPSRANKEFWGGSIPWINSGKANEFRVINPTEYITQKGLNNSSTKLLPKRTVLIAITGATLGQVSLSEIDTCANQSIVGVTSTKKLPGEYLYLWIRENIQTLVSHKTGGAQQHINKENVNDLSILVPNNNILSVWSEVATPIFNKVSLNCFANHSLTKIRDTLLPKLLSGELTVEQLEVANA